MELFGCPGMVGCVRINGLVGSNGLFCLLINGIYHLLVTIY